jgi:hypothetical protein
MYLAHARTSTLPSPQVTLDGEEREEEEEVVVVVVVVQEPRSFPHSKSWAGARGRSA